MESKTKVILRTIDVDSEEMEIRNQIYLYDDPADWCRLGQYYWSEEKLPLAEHAFRYAYRKDPSLWKALKALGEVYLQQGLISKAIACFHKLECLVPGYLAEHDLEN